MTIPDYYYETRGSGIRIVTCLVCRDCWEVSGEITNGQWDPYDESGLLCPHCGCRGQVGDPDE